jgi:hypothetical protein
MAARQGEQTARSIPTSQGRRYETSEPDEALAFLRQAFGIGRMRIRTPLAPGWALRSGILDAGAFRSGLVVVPGEAHYRTERRKTTC